MPAHQRAHKMDLEQLLQLGQDNATAVVIAIAVVLLSLVLVAGLGRRKAKVFLDPQVRDDAGFAAKQRLCAATFDNMQYMQ